MRLGEVSQRCLPLWHHQGMATEEDKQAARERLVKLTGRYEKAENQLEEVRKEVTDEIAATLMARILGPSEVTRLSPFERQHVGRIAKAAGVPPLREATVVSRAKAAAPKESRSAAAAPRRQVTESVSERRETVPDSTISTPVAAMSNARVKELAEAAEKRHPEWIEEIRQAHPTADELRLHYLIVEAGVRMGFRPRELDKEQSA